MDHVPAELFPQSDQDKYFDVAYTDRWECLKPIIVKLYMGDYGKGGRTTTINQVADFMRANYSFHAAPTEYPGRFRAWNINKRVVKDMKDDVTNAFANRKQPGTSTSRGNITQEGHSQRLCPKEAGRIHPVPGPVQTLTPGLLSSWNLPYEAFISSIYQDVNKPSPFGPLSTTPGYLNIESPSPLTPGREMAGPSPNMQLVYQQAKENRATLLLQGRLEDLIIGMCKEDRKLIFDYYHDFYIHGLVMAKNWGRDQPDRQPTLTPAVATKEGIEIEDPTTPSAYLNLPLSSSVSTSPVRIDVLDAPTKLCNLAVDVSSPKGGARREDIPVNLPPEETAIFSFTEELRQSIISSSFTSTEVNDLPVAQDIIADVIKNDPTALELDAWKLAIMSGNPELLESLRDNNNGKLPDGIDSIHPFHLAASFLDGSRSCCMIFEILSDILGFGYTLHHNVDNFGHTILDTLMVSILRSHSSISPDVLSHGFHRFLGEENDICGRWDPETPKIRELFRQGFSRIPSEWKHPLCHTAVQTICHSIDAIFGTTCVPNINQKSGLFIRRCTECGMELRLGPLHALVMTTFYLAQLGMSGETLFGPLAVLVRLVGFGADVSLTANVSLEELLGASEAGTCHHSHLSPIELMRRIPQDVINDWSDDCKVGWNCFAETLTRAETDKYFGLNNRSALDSDDEQHRCDSTLKLGDERFCAWLNFSRLDSEIGLISATVQNELVTYRRMKDDDPWVSKNFSMKALEAWLLGHTGNFLTPMVKDQMVQTHSQCGWFSCTNLFLCPMLLARTRPLGNSDIMMFGFFEGYGLSSRLGNQLNRLNSASL
ncbi:hypothetical protein HD806DRAFT_513918 [Xylariaceae sp. AK1471]|nr:hypothetical protein HD806DRAFT_513918 [Xylariaceae sp. AK1471]